MKKTIITLLLLSTTIFAMSAKPKIYQDYHIIGINTEKEAITPLMLKNALVKNGITVTQFDTLDTPSYQSYHLLQFKDEKIITPIMKKIPTAALFHTMSMAIYQKKDDPYLWISLLSSRTHSKVLNLHNGANAFGSYDRHVISALLTIIERPRFQQHNSSQKRQLKKLDIYKHVSSSDGKKLIKNLKSALGKKGFTVDRITDITISSDYDYVKSIRLHEANTLNLIIAKNPEAGAYFPANILILKRKDATQAELMHVDAGNIIDSSNIQKTESLRALVRRQALLDTLLAK